MDWNKRTKPSSFLQRNRYHKAVFEHGYEGNEKTFQAHYHENTGIDKWGSKIFRRHPRQEKEKVYFFFGILAPDFRATLRAIATACFLGLPASISVRMLELTAFLLFPLESGIIGPFCHLIGCLYIYTAYILRIQ